MQYKNVMNILVLGSNNNDEIFLKKVHNSHHCSQLFFQSNGSNELPVGIIKVENLKSKEAIRIFCLEKKIDLLIILNRDLSIIGIYDELKLEDIFKKIIIIGASKKLIILEDDEKLIHFISKYNIANSKEKRGEYFKLIVLTNGRDFKIINQQKDYLSENDINKIIATILSALNKEEILVTGILAMNFIFENGKAYFKNFDFNIYSSDFINLETDLVSLFAAMDNETLADTNIEFV